MNKKTRSLTNFIITSYRGYYKHLLLTIITASVMSVTDVFYPLLIKRFTDVTLKLPESQQKIELMWILGIFVVVIIIAIFGRWEMTYLHSVVTDKILYSFRIKLFAHYQKMDFQYFDSERTGGILDKIDGDVNKMDSIIYQLPSWFTSMAANMITGIILYSQLNYKILLMEIPLIIAVVAFLPFYKKGSIECFKHCREVSQKASEQLEDCISGIRTTISFDQSEFEISRMRKLYDDCIERYASKYKRVVLKDSVFGLFNNLFILIMIVGGFYYVTKGEMSILDVAIFYGYGYGYVITTPINNLNGITKQINESRASYERVMDVLKTEPNIENPQYPYIDHVTEGTVVFQNVSFKYEEDKEENILEDLSFEIEKGKFVAIVGPSGAGKSTIASLIPRYYDVKKGSIRIDGINVKDYDLHSLRKDVGILMQDTFLFYGSILDNILYGCPNASMEEVIRAAKAANIHDFVSSLPDGYRTIIGEREAQNYPGVRSKGLQLLGYS